jgi:hypothetical protein
MKDAAQSLSKIRGTVAAAGFEFAHAEGAGTFFTARFRHRDGRELLIAFDRMAWTVAGNPSHEFSFRNHRYLSKALAEALAWAGATERAK